MEKLIPIGSIVYLKEGQQKMMILNRGPQVETDEGIKMFDYSACEYPAGFIPEEIFYFNIENIEKIIFEGYSDEDEESFTQFYRNWLINEGKNILKGKVEKD